MKCRFYLLNFLLFAFSSIVSAQNISEEEPKIFYRNEKTVALNFVTSGWGLGYRYGSRVNYFEKKLFEAEFTVLRHPKEIKSTSTFLSSKSYVFGKLNSVYDLRFVYGKQNEIYGKDDAGSVAIRYFYSLGPSVAFLKPIYYDVNYIVDDTVRVFEEKFNLDIHNAGAINGKAPYFKGFNEIKLVPGAFVKAGINFEFSQSDITIHALEAGLLFQAYTSSLDIMATDDNQQFFFSLFVCYRLGKIVNAQNISDNYFEKRKRGLRIFKRN